MGHLTDIPYIGQFNIDKLLADLNSAMVRQYGDTLDPFSMLIVGGAALAVKYDFRMTVDIDADVRFSRKLQDAIDMVAKYEHIPTDWLNYGFMNTNSYSKRLWNNALPYKVFGFISVYIVNDLDQLCMKSTTSRDKDLKDIKFLISKLVVSGYKYSDYINEFLFLYGDSVKPSYKFKSRIEREFKKYKMYS